MSEINGTLSAAFETFLGFNFVKSHHYDKYQEVLVYLLPLAIVSKEEHFPCIMTVLLMLDSLFSSYMKKPFNYFRIVINSLLYYGNTFRFLSKSG